GVATGEMTCDDPSGAAWRITALLDGLAVQSTVHEGVLSRRQVTAWVRANAARELGVEPRELRG
ncbi:MAG: TetR family transcriptional regulator C-terminal domain-containing protein, partial [Actinomycetes bacterium]